MPEEPSAADWPERLRALYEALEREQAGLAADCRGCGDCCRFDRVDHVLYASRLERLYLALRAANVNFSDADADLIARGLRCPFQRDGQCLAREGRALGCRLYFCALDGRPGVDEMYERWHARLRALHDELGVEWDYRPLLPLPDVPPRPDTGRK